jgi:hypothetical protein
MDETDFLSKYYKTNRKRGMEIVSLAYENSTDFERSQKSLRKFQQRFQVDYPMLITGVSVNDSLRTEKTLPQLTRIKAFPTSIIIDKKGKFAISVQVSLDPAPGHTMWSTSGNLKSG